MLIIGNPATIAHALLGRRLCVPTFQWVCPRDNRLVVGRYVVIVAKDATTVKKQNVVKGIESSQWAMLLWTNQAV